MKFRKGTEVRIRRTGQIATIEEVELIRWGGEVRKYCHLKIGGSPRDLWMLSSELTEVRERVTIAFRSSCCPKEVELRFIINWKTREKAEVVPASLMEKLQAQDLPDSHEALAMLLMQAVCERWGGLQSIVDLRR